MEWQWQLIQKECTGCGICADVCSWEAIEMTRDMAYPKPVRSKCTGCMECVEQCPVDAIEVEEGLSVERR